MSNKIAFLQKKSSCHPSIADGTSGNRAPAGCRRTFTEYNKASAGYSSTFAGYGKVLAFLLTLCLVLSMTATAQAANSSAMPTASDNLCINLIKRSRLVATADGYMRVYYNGDKYWTGDKIGIEYYDNSFNLLSKKFLDMELPYWGGFFAGADGSYYIVEAQANPDEIDSAEVIRVIKYDKNWNKLGTAKITGNPSLFGGEVGYPLNYGCVEMAEYNGMLYIVTGHRGYVDESVGQGHQGFLMVEVNESAMTGKIVDSDLWHSFAQYITCSDSNLYVLEQSDGDRATTLTRYDANTLSSKRLYVLNYGGKHTSAWAIACYASVDDLAVSSDNVLGVGTSIDQTQYDSVTSDTAHNIYLTVTPKSNFTTEATTVKWITNYSGDGKSFLGVYLTKINENRFLLSWEEWKESQTADLNDTLSSSILHYVFLDGAGNRISQEYTASAPISDCKPIVKGDSVVYYASNSNMVNFYTINTSTGAFNKKMYRVAGDSATWDINNGVLTISGTGAVSIDGSGKYRYPVSSTTSWYTSDGNSWSSVRDSVTKIVISSGITELAEESFSRFNNLTEVEIQSGLTGIGAKAFAYCNKLSKITIPGSVTSIGEDILWTGSYWISDDSHVTYATIYGPGGSYVETYAKENKISFRGTYNVTLNTNGGTIAAGKQVASYVSGTTTALPTASDITKTGMDFGGWYDNPSFIGDPIAEINTAQTGDKTYYAKWNYPSPTRAFATRLYEKCLGRAPEAAGLEYWDTALKNKTHTGAMAAQGFVFSEEYKQKHTSDEEYVEMLYNVFMDRASDAGGKAYWLDLLSNGVSREYVFRGFTDSQEFTNICKAYDIERGTIVISQARDQNPKLTAYVNRMYTQALGRPGEEDGLNDWCTKIQKGTMTPEQVAEAFIYSKEFTMKNLNDEEYIKVLYRTFMGREYDAQGLEYWKNQLAHGTSREDILHGFSRSAEFKNIQTSFGL